jgi:uncharacterized protein (TIGR03435 family)
MGSSARSPRTALAVALICTTSLWPQSLTHLTAAQSPSQSSTPEWQTAAGGKMVFDSASVKQNTTAPPNAVYFNFPIGPGDVYTPTGGTFRANNLPLVNYILFAYKIAPNQEEFITSQLPKWGVTDRFDIQAKAQGNPTKDQMRLMMQALLADRFRLAAHHEIRQVPVFALLVDQPGRLGPLLQKHPEGAPCPTTSAVPSPPPTAPPQAVDNRFPASCGGELPMVPSAPGRVRGGARNVSMELIAGSLADGGGVDRPIVDRTGLSGKYDFAIEYSPEGPSSVGANFRPDPTGPTFEQALKEQLGLKLESQTGPMDMLVIDFIGEPSPN